MFSDGVNKALSVDVSELMGVRYKVLDDLIDGIFCAYLAYYFWYWGEERSWIVGDMIDGYVALPRCKLPNCRLNQDLPLTTRL
jgi:predicted RNase H-like nuclease